MIPANSSLEKRAIHHALIAGLALLFMLAMAGCGGRATPTPVPTDTPLPTATPAPTDTPAPTATPVPTVTPAGETQSAASASSAPAPSQYAYAVVNSYPHDVNAYTQGLVYADDIFYEGTGLNGNSTLRKVDPVTGEVLNGLQLPAEYFGEGITVLDDKIYQLTWHAQTGFIFDKNNLELISQFSYPTEGWGLTHDGARLIMSDGSATLYFLDPETLQEIGRIGVVNDQHPVDQLNELEFVDGLIYANVWQTDRIAQIDPETGHVVGWIDLTGLLTEDEFAQISAQLNPDKNEATEGWIRSGAVLNGIAYDAANDRLFVTGKLWPKVVEIELVPIGE